MLLLISLSLTATWKEKYIMNFPFVITIINLVWDPVLKGSHIKVKSFVLQAVEAFLPLTQPYVYSITLLMFYFPLTYFCLQFPFSPLVVVFTFKGSKAFFELIVSIWKNCIFSWIFFCLTTPSLHVPFCWKPVYLYASWNDTGSRAARIF